jgi:hypothetical protein
MPHEMPPLIKPMAAVSQGAEMHLFRHVETGSQERPKLAAIITRPQSRIIMRAFDLFTGGRPVTPARE